MLFWLCQIDVNKILSNTCWNCSYKLFTIKTLQLLIIFGDLHNLEWCFIKIVCFKEQILYQIKILYEGHKKMLELVVKASSSIVFIKLIYLKFQLNYYITSFSLSFRYNFTIQLEYYKEVTRNVADRYWELLFYWYFYILTI